MEPIICTDENIHNLVKEYIDNKTTLGINNWDVSAVTNMEDLFSACYEFNQSLNGWNVSNVTNMSGMFMNH